MKKLLVLLASMIVVACAAEEGATTDTTTASASAAPAPVVIPTKEEAAAIIRDSAELGDYQFTNAAFSLPVQRSMRNEPTAQNAAELREAGWIAFDGSGNVVLTEKSRDDKRFLTRPNGFIDIVPLAKKEFGEVSSVTAKPDGNAIAEFSWRWVPNEVGSAFETGLVKDRFSADHRARATLMQDGGKWSILIIEPAAKTTPGAS